MGHGLKIFGKCFGKPNLLKSKYGPPPFLRRTSTGLTVLVTYIDEIIITDTNSYGIHRLQDSLHASFV